MIRLSLSVFLVLFTGCFNIKEEPKPNPEEPLGLLWSIPYTYVSLGPEMAPETVGDTLVIFTGDHNITCLYSATGEVKWVTQISEIVAASIRKLIVDESKLYGWQVEQGYKAVYALDLNTGAKNWEYETNDRIKRYHSLSSQYYYVGVSNDSMKLYLCFSKNGQLNFERRVPHAPWSTQYVGGKIVCGQGWYEGPNMKGQLSCFNADTGDSLWMYYTQYGGFSRVPTIFENGVLYCGTVYGSPNSIVVALNAETGDEIWTFSREGQYAEYHDIKLVDGVLYCSTNTGVVAISADTGQELWFTEPVFSHNENTLDYWDGYIYIPHTGSLWVLEAETGEIVHKMRGPDESPVLKVSAGAGKIFVQSTQHLYAFTPYDPEKDNDQ